MVTPIIEKLFSWLKEIQPKHLNFRNIFYKYVLKQHHIYSKQWFKQHVTPINQYYTEQTGTKLVRK